ncbi:hypothetical protein CH063_09894, partial [Colletotrichum higginsianum]
MAAINEAYEVLSNPELRERFDRGDDPNNQEQGNPFQGNNPFGGGHPFMYQQGGSQQVPLQVRWRRRRLSFLREGNTQRMLFFWKESTVWIMEFYKSKPGVCGGPHPTADIFLIVIHDSDLRNGPESETPRQSVMFSVSQLVDLGLPCQYTRTTTDT